MNFVNAMRNSMRVRPEGVNDSVALYPSRESFMNKMGRAAAEMHTHVTILFTDIVGFTAMSQACQPLDVMTFLDKLFVRFDHHVDEDPCLWKVETIGDAFMMASGLNMRGDSSSVRSLEQPSGVIASTSNTAETE